MTDTCCFDLIQAPKKERRLLNLGEHHQRTVLLYYYCRTFRDDSVFSTQVFAFAVFDSHPEWSGCSTGKSNLLYISLYTNNNLSRKSAERMWYVKSQKLYFENNIIHIFDWLANINVLFFICVTTLSSIHLLWAVSFHLRNCYMFFLFLFFLLLLFFFLFFAFKNITIASGPLMSCQLVVFPLCLGQVKRTWHCWTTT